MGPGRRIPGGARNHQASGSEEADSAILHRLFGRRGRSGPCSQLEVEITVESGENMPASVESSIKRVVWKLDWSHWNQGGAALPIRTIPADTPTPLAGRRGQGATALANSTLNLL